MTFSNFKRELENWQETRSAGEARFLNTFVWRKWPWISLVFSGLCLAVFYAASAISKSEPPSALGMFVAGLTLFLTMQLGGYVVALFIWRINEFLFARKSNGS